MSIVKNFLSSIFGSKSARDLKELSPIVEKVNKFSEELRNLSDDELREITFQFKDQIKNSCKDEIEQISILKTKINNTTDTLIKESYYKDIDNFNKKSLDKKELELEKILPKAFALIKETSLRLVNNGYLKVKARDYDSVSSKCDYVKIDGEFSIWSNTWLASGVSQKWNMIHYDVQLIGGLVLHKGKVAEMQTGEEHGSYSSCLSQRLDW